MATLKDLPCYQHQPLDDEALIRILEILPGGDSDILECRLRPVNPGSFTDYETLSYVWGDPSNPIPIKCDGAQIAIGRSLYAALLQLRRPDAVRVIWADALCINQTNTAERSSQVAKMGYIYRRAKYLDIWLGLDEAGDADAVFALIRDAGQKIDQVVASTDGEYFSPKTTLDDIFGTDKQIRVALQKMFSLPWFHRVWIVQESGLSANAILHWGKSTLNRAFLLKLWMFLFVNRGTLLLNWRLNMTPFYLFFNYYKPLQHSQPGDKCMEFQRLLDCLQLARSLEATDPRDRVYAFLAHPIFDYGKETLDDFLRESDSCTASKALGIKPDYYKGLPEIYLELAKKLFLVMGNMRVLYSVTHHSVVETDLPSWVPRWDLGITPGVIMGLDPPNLYDASRKREEAVFEVEDRELEAKGIIITKIDFITNTMDGGHFLFDAIDTLGGLLQPKNPVEQLFEAVGPWLTRVPSPYEDVIHAFTVTLTNGLLNSNPVESPTQRAQFDANFSAYRLAKAKQFSAQMTGGPPSMLQTLESKAEGGDPMDAARDLNAACNGRKFFSTLQGYVGLCPAVAQLDDVVAVLFGARIPVVLRPIGDSGKYLFLGEAYCHGFMRGEAIDLLEKGMVREQGIVLC